MPRHLINFSIVAVSIFLFSVFSKTVFASTWYFPMDKYYERQTVKGFGDYIDDNFYKGKEALFPYNRFYGYHAAVDLETFPDEKRFDTPVYAVYPGTITYIGTLQGYGGVILEKLDGQNATALYGHVRIFSTPYKIGSRIDINNQPVFLVNLGDEFSSQTSLERKHLHFAIHKGEDLYFHGHEPSLAILNAKWISPNDFLKEKGAVHPTENLSAQPSPQISPTPQDTPALKFTKSQNIFVLFLNWIMTLFK